MSIIETSISDDIKRDDDKLSFTVQNSFQYEFNRSTDLYITGYNEPVGVVMGNVGELKNRLRTGYVLKKVGSEDISVEVFLGSSGTPFHVRQITVEYYIQTSSDESGGGTNDGDGTFIDVTKK